MNQILVLIMTASLMSVSFPAPVEQLLFPLGPKMNDPSLGDTQSLGLIPAPASDPAFKTPDWVKNAIFYQIFPDRFRDGNAANNPENGDLLWKEWSRGDANYAQKMNWTDLPEEPASGRDWFGGDLQGVQEKAQYLADLGVTAIYFNPLMDSTDNHGYTVIDYKSVNRYFGANKRAETGTPEVDIEGGLEVFRNMTSELDKYGIRVILDGVFNHVSAKHQWFDRDNDYPTDGAYESQSSQWYTWFNFSNWPNYYRGWQGFLNLREVNEVAKFKNYVYMDPNDSVI